MCDGVTQFTLSAGGGIQASPAQMAGTSYGSRGYRLTAGSQQRGECMEEMLPSLAVFRQSDGTACWNQEVQGLLQMRRRCARASLAPCAGAWTPHSPLIARVGLFPYLVHIFYLSSIAKETSLGIAKRHRQAIAKCLAGAKCIRPPVRPYPLSFDLMHG